MSEMETIKSTNLGGSSIHCYICNSRAGVSIRNAVQIFNEQIKLAYTERPLYKAIEELTEKCLDREKKPPPILCKKCFKLIEEHDELKSRMDEIKKDLLMQFNKTSNLIDNNETDQNLKSSDLPKTFPSTGDSQLKTLTPVVIKKELIPAVKPQKKIPVISMKNVTKLPANFIVVNQEGKIAVQNLDMAENKMTSPTFIEEKSNQVKTKEGQSMTPTSGMSDVKNIIRISRKISLEGTEPLIVNNSELLSQDIEMLENSGRNENSEEGEYEGVETLEDMEENENAFITSDLKILEDPSDGALEDGTILVEQEADGTIRFLKHADNLYAAQYLHVEVEASDDEMDEANLQDDEDNTDSERPKKPRIVRQRTDKIIFKTKPLTNHDTPLDQIVKRLSDQLYQCLICDKHIKEKNAEVDNTESLTLEISNENGEVKTGKILSNNVDENKSEDVIKTEDATVESEHADKENECESKNDKQETKIIEGFFGSSKVLMQHFRGAHNLTVFICHFCGKVFSKRVEFNQHTEKHKMEEVSLSEYKCTLCKEVFGSIKEFRVHTKFHHKDVAQKQHACQICNRKFPSKKLLAEHNNIHIGVKPYACELCGKSFASKYTYQSHCKTHTDRPRPYCCSQCGKSFFTLQNKTQHEKTHLGIKDFVCNVCGKAFGTQHNLDVHGVVHTGYKPYKCWICKKAFARRAEIRDHERIHTGERPYGCDICGSTFSQRSNLQSHKRATHFDDKRYKCRNCDKSFKRRRLLEYHIKSSHTGERPYKCEICEATFVYPEHFKKHTRIHSGEKPYTCEVCGKAFNSRDNRNAHRFIHSDKKPYECLDCGAGFMRKPLLYAHMQQQGHLNDTIIVNQPRITNEIETKLDLENAFILEDGQEVIINNIKEEVLSENPLDRKITLTEDMFETEFVEEGSKLIVRSGSGMKNDAIIVHTQGGLDKDGVEMETSDIVGVEDGETTIITGDMIDSQRIHIIEATEDQQGQALEIEDGSMRFFQIRLSNGENSWVALNNAQEE